MPACLTIIVRYGVRLFMGCVCEHCIHRLPRRGTHVLVNLSPLVKKRRVEIPLRGGEATGQQGVGNNNDAALTADLRLGSTQPDGAAKDKSRQRPASIKSTNQMGWTLFKFRIAPYDCALERWNWSSRNISSSAPLSRFLSARSGRV